MVTNQQRDNSKSNRSTQKKRTTLLCIDFVYENNASLLWKNLIPILNRIIRFQALDPWIYSTTFEFLKMEVHFSQFFEQNGDKRENKTNRSYYLFRCKMKISRNPERKLDIRNFFFLSSYSNRISIVIVKNFCFLFFSFHFFPSNPKCLL